MRFIFKRFDPLGTGHYLCVDSDEERAGTQGVTNAPPGRQPGDVSESPAPRPRNVVLRGAGRVAAGIGWIFVDPLGTILEGIAHVAAMPDQRKTPPPPK